jgi:hypothetical protein
VLLPFCILKVFLKKIKFFLFFSFLQINIFFFIFSDNFDMLISKIIFKKYKKNIILKYFQVNNTLKDNRKHTPKYPNKQQFA